jgi:hypothetical protein
VVWRLSERIPLEADQVAASVPVRAVREDIVRFLPSLENDQLGNGQTRPKLFKLNPGHFPFIAVMAVIIRRVKARVYLPVDGSVHPRHVPGTGEGEAGRSSSRRPGQELLRRPGKMETVLSHDQMYEELARKLFRATDFLFLGRGVHCPSRWRAR